MTCFHFKSLIFFVFLVVTLVQLESARADVVINPYPLRDQKPFSPKKEPSRKLEELPVLDIPPIPSASPIVEQVEKMPPLPKKRPLQKRVAQEPKQERPLPKIEQESGLVSFLYTLGKGIVENSSVDKKKSVPDGVSWVADSGADIKNILHRWSRKAGVSFVWDTTRKFSVLESLNIGTSYEEAVQAILDQHQDRAYRPVAHLYVDPETKHKTLVIQATAR